jgi:ABC-type phosphate transport system permease subunit
MLTECLLLAWGVSSLASVLNRRMTWGYVMAYSAMAMAVIGNMLFIQILAETLFRGSQPDFWSFAAFFSPLSAFLSYVKQGSFGVYVSSHEVMGLLTLAYVALVAGTTIGLTYAVFLGRYWGKAWRNPLNRGASPGGRPSESQFVIADCRPDLSSNT